MAHLAAAVAIAGTVATIAGTVIQGRAIKKQGAASNDAALYEAAQLERTSKEEYAAGQREGMEIDRQTGILQGEMRSKAAASGAGASDDTVVRLASEVARQGGYRRDLAIYGAIERAKGLRAQAVATRKAGVASLQGSRLGAAGTVIAGLGSAAYNAASFFQQFGKKQPIKVDDPVDFPNFLTFP